MLDCSALGMAIPEHACAGELPKTVMIGLMPQLQALRDVWMLHTSSSRFDVWR
jgi:hypothetical protein